MKTCNREALRELAGDIESWDEAQFLYLLRVWDEA